MNKDYSLTGRTGRLAVKNGLAEAQWYQSSIPKKEMRELLKRRNWPGIRDTFIWFALLGLTGYCGIVFWGTWLSVLSFAVYGILYASAADARWHETSHGTVFKTDRLNTVVYEISSFMMFRESTPWRWSHTRHHSDTLVVGRDPEITMPRPPTFLKFFRKFVPIHNVIKTIKKILRRRLSGKFEEAGYWVLTGNCRW